MYDHADWLEVKITTRGEVEPLPVWARPISRGKYNEPPARPQPPRRWGGWVACGPGERFGVALSALV